MTEGTLSMSSFERQFAEHAEQARAHGAGHPVAVAVNQAMSRLIVLVYHALRAVRSARAQCAAVDLDMPRGHVVPAEAGGAGQPVSAQALAQVIVADDLPMASAIASSSSGSKSSAACAAGLGDRAAAAGGDRAAAGHRLDQRHAEALEEAREHASRWRAGRARAGARRARGRGGARASGAGAGQRSPVGLPGEHQVRSLDSRAGEGAQESRVVLVRPQVGRIEQEALRQVEGRVVTRRARA